MGKIKRKNSLKIECWFTYQRVYWVVFLLQIVATDGGDPARTGTLSVRINVQDLNDSPPKFTEQRYFTNILEDTPVGASILQVIFISTVLCKWHKNSHFCSIPQGRATTHFHWITSTLPCMAFEEFRNFSGIFHFFPSCDPHDLCDLCCFSGLSGFAVINSHAANGSNKTAIFQQ